ncbi:50S ribosomal protein L11 methyltransferase [Pseudorhodoplanes sp.]|uniref:50S ribosomal protein L11 methyltransferase n=1 Tax=Pseudorhodoplanes sp. TaxID=1934341 RepID=UPI00391DA537
MNAPTPPAETFVACLAAERPLAERLADALSDMLDPQTCAVSLFESGEHWAVEAAFHDPDDRNVISSLVARIAGPERSRALTFSSIAKRDWVAASLEGLAPVRAGRIVVHGSHDRARVRPNEIGIEIEAALAFGTGHHGTTRGCLLAFERLRKAAPHPQRLRILDVGTGTGVLAIAAARALRVRVLASDIDPQAVAVARDNARLNRVATLLRAVTAGGIEAAVIRNTRYNLIFANILEAPLRRMSAGLSALLAPGGRLILSGLLAVQAAGVIAAYRRQGLRLQARLDLDGWVTLTMRR